VSYRGKGWEAKKKFDKAVKDYEDAIKLDPQDPRIYAFRAWMLATCPDEKYRDGKKAVELAKKAVDLAKMPNGEYAEALAAAHAEAGNFDEAVSVQERALEDATLKNDADARRRLELYRDKKPYRQE